MVKVASAKAKPRSQHVKKEPFRLGAAKAKPRSQHVKKKPHFRVGTDCSGIEVAVAAMQEMGIRTEHVFSSETNPRLR